MTIEVRELSCPSCGAPLQCTTDTPIAVCPFCDSRLAAAWETLAKRIELEDVAVQVLPFTVSKDDFEDQLLAFLADGAYTPDDVLTAAMVREHGGLFVPAWRYWGRWSAEWTAQAGFSRTESYVETDRRFEDGKWIEVPVQKTRTVTDWRPWSGESAGDYDRIVLASSRVPESLIGFCESGLPTPEQLQPFESQMLERCAAEPPASPPDVVWQDRGLARIRGEAIDTITESIHADTVRAVEPDLQVTPGGSARVLLPFWLVTYEYGGQTFHAIADGADPTRFEGKRPVDQERKDRVSALYKPVYWAAAAWIILTLLGFIAFVVPGVLILLVGGAGVFYLYSRAKTQETELIDASREVRRQALERIRARGGGIAEGLD